MVLLYHHGGYRIWRTLKEALVRSCIRERWKDYSEFMFWGCFSYDKKGPYHIWKPETAAERKKADKEIAKLNEELKPLMREEWELCTPMRRHGLRNLPGPKSKWNWNVANSKLIREKDNGIN